MGSYYYVDDPTSDMGYTPLPEEEYLKAYKAIVRRNGLKITGQAFKKIVPAVRRGVIEYIITYEN